MATKCTLEQLPDVVEKCIKDYGQKAEKTVRKDVLAVSLEAQRQLQSSSPRRRGKYAASWARKLENGRLGDTTAILHSKLPGLPHLLEHGHALRGGGRARAIPHIAPVEQWSATELEKRISTDLQKL